MANDSHYLKVVHFDNLHKSVHNKTKFSYLWYKSNSVDNFYKVYFPVHDLDWKSLVEMFRTLDLPIIHKKNRTLKNQIVMNH